MDDMEWLEVVFRLQNACTGMSTPPPFKLLSNLDNLYDYCYCDSIILSNVLVVGVALGVS